MTYQVLSIKWRPQRFEEVVGQQHVAVTLQNSIKQDRLAHAYLFTGPRGVGKTTTARILAKYLNCTNPQDFNPCNECKNCREITAGRSFDVLEIDGASNNGVENIRDLREAVKYPPSDGKYKIYIIDEVHMLSTSAFNALLKTLEEPPSHVKFIFATTEPERVLPTIISRTQRFDFKRIPLPVIREQLQKICNAEDLAVSQGALTLIARKADGSMRDAESLLDQVISFSGQEITDESVASVLGVVDYDIYLRLAAIQQEQSASAVLDLLAEVMESGYDLGEFLSGLADFWRNLLVLQSAESPEAGLVDIPETYLKQFTEATQNYNERDLLRLLNLTLTTQLQFRQVRNQRIFLENFLLKLVHFDRSIRLDEILQKTPGSSGSPQSMQPQSSTAPDKKAVNRSGTTRRNIGQKKTTISTAGASGDTRVATERTESAATSPPKNEGTVSDDTGERDIARIQKEWPAFTDYVQEKTGLLGQFLIESVPTAVNGKVLEILFDEAFRFHMKTVVEKSSQVEQFIREFFNWDVRLKCQVGKTNKPPEPEDDQIIDDPITQAVINHFDGEIIR